MNYSDKVKQFLKVKGLNQKDLANRFDKKEPLISRWVNNPSLDFLQLMIKEFPDFDLNYIMKESPAYSDELTVDSVAEEQSGYGKNPKQLIEEIEERLALLKDKVK